MIFNSRRRSSRVHSRIFWWTGNLLALALLGTLATREALAQSSSTVFVSARATLPDNPYLVSGAICAVDSGLDLSSVSEIEIDASGLGCFGGGRCRFANQQRLLAEFVDSNGNPIFILPADYHRTPQDLLLCEGDPNVSCASTPALYVIPPSIPVPPGADATTLFNSGTLPVPDGAQALIFGFNDSTYGDNSGGYTVTTSRPPEESALVIQDLDSMLFQVDLAESPSLSELVCDGLGAEINCAGIRRSDGLVYGVELTTFPNGNNGIVRIDPDLCILEHLGSAGLPAGQRFDAGDLSNDGSTMFINRAGLNPLYTVDLTTSPLEAIRVDLTGAKGYVHDWAYRSTDGLLYGGDSLDGQLAILDPLTGARTDAALTDTGLGTIAAGTAYGGAWFDAQGRLVLYRNDGEIYVIDVDSRTVVDVDTGRASIRNEAAGRR